MLEKIRIGKITSTHGLKGEMRVFPETEDLERYRTIKNVFLSRDGESFEGPIEAVEKRLSKACWIIRLSGIDTIEKAEKLRNTDLYVDRADAIPLKKGEYFQGDLIGMRVQAFGSDIGVLKGFIQTGPVNVMEIKGKTNVLIPYRPEFVERVDEENGIIHVTPIPGMLELNS